MFVPFFVFLGVQKTGDACNGDLYRGINRSTFFSVSSDSEGINIRIIRLINIKPIQEQATPEPVHIVRTVNEPKERMQVRYERPISLFAPSNEPTFTVPRRIFIPSESEETEKKVERLIYDLCSSHSLYF